ncbi:MAG: penicillin-binding protein activator [Pseudomonadota bacterium]
MLCLVIAGCAPQRGGPTASGASQPRPGTQAPADQPGATPLDAGPATVALLVPLSGGDEQSVRLGNALANAAKMAAGEPSAADLELRVYDTRGLPDGARQMAERAIRGGAQIILGPLFSASTQAAGDVAAQSGVKVVSFSTDTSVAGDPVYLSGFIPELEAARILDFASRRGMTTLGVYAPDTPYGAAAGRGVDVAAPSAGMAVVATTSYPRSFQGIQETSGDFAAEATANGAQAILLPDGGQGLRSVAAFMDFNGLPSSSVQYLGLGQWETRATLEEPALRGGWFPGPAPSAVDAFADRYAIRYGERPPVLSVLGYDAVRIAAEVVADARKSPQGLINDALLTRPQGFPGAFGPIRFLPDGRGDRALAIMEVGAGQFVVLEPAPTRFGAGF